MRERFAGRGAALLLTPRGERFARRTRGRAQAKILADISVRAGVCALARPDGFLEAEGWAGSYDLPETFGALLRHVVDRKKCAASWSAPVGLARPYSGQAAERVDDRAALGELERAADAFVRLKALPTDPEEDVSLLDAHETVDFAVVGVILKACVPELPKNIRAAVDAAAEEALKLTVTSAPLNFEVHRDVYSAVAQVFYQEPNLSAGAVGIRAVEMLLIDEQISRNQLGNVYADVHRIYGDAATRLMQTFDRETLSEIGYALAVRAVHKARKESKMRGADREDGNVAVAPDDVGVTFVVVASDDDAVAADDNIAAADNDLTATSDLVAPGLIAPEPVSDDSTARVAESDGAAAADAVDEFYAWYARFFKKLVDDHRHTLADSVEAELAKDQGADVLTAATHYAESIAKAAIDEIEAAIDEIGIGIGTVDLSIAIRMLDSVSRNFYELFLIACLDKKVAEFVIADAKAAALLPPPADDAATAADLAGPALLPDTGAVEDSFAPPPVPLVALDGATKPFPFEAVEPA